MLRSLMENVLKTAREDISKHGDATPMVFFYKGGNMNYHPIDVGKGKSLTKKAIQLYIRIEKPDAAIVLSEIWYVERPIEVKDNPPLPSEQPDRKEAIMVLGGCVECQEVLLVPFTRLETSVRFQDPVKQDGSTTMESDFFGDAWEQRRKMH